MQRHGQEQGRSWADLSVAAWQVPQVEAHQSHRPPHLLLCNMRLSFSQC